MTPEETLLEATVEALERSSTQETSSPSDLQFRALLGALKGYGQHALVRSNLQGVTIRIPQGSNTIIIYLDSKGWDWNEVIKLEETF